MFNSIIRESQSASKITIYQRNNDDRLLPWIETMAELGYLY
jgi:hypothetical protein